MATGGPVTDGLGAGSVDRDNGRELSASGFGSGWGRRHETRSSKFNYVE